MSNTPVTNSISKLYLHAVTASVAVAASTAGFNFTDFKIGPLNKEFSQIHGLMSYSTTSTRNADEEALGGIMTLDQYNELADLADEFFKKF